MRGFATGGPAGSHFGGDLDSLFDDLLGGRRPFTRTQTRRGQDIETPLEVTLEEAFHGAARTLALQVEEPCANCQGTGYVRNTPCPVCRGAGVIAATRRIEVKIPPGVKDGSRIRIAGQGQHGLGGPNGDLYLVITVKPHPVFKRLGDDLEVDLEVPLTVAVLGGEVEVPSMRGKLALKIPPETQNGRLIRLSRQGMPHLGDSASGDIIARVHVQLPTGLTSEEKELFQRLRQLRPSS